MTARNVLKIMTIAATSAILLSGCETMTNPFADKPAVKKLGQEETLRQDLSCPDVTVMPELSQMTVLRGEGVVAKAEIDKVVPSCQGTGASTTVRLNFGFKGTLGPVGKKDAVTEASYSIPYLVSVVAPKGDIISKDIFTITMTFKNGQSEKGFSDILEQIIPIKAGENVADYRIIVGFLLTEQDLAYNRKKVGLSAAR